MKQPTKRVVVVVLFLEVAPTGVLASKDINRFFQGGCSKRQRLLNGIEKAAYRPLGYRVDIPRRVRLDMRLLCPTHRRFGNRTPNHSGRNATQIRRVNIQDVRQPLARIRNIYRLNRRRWRRWRHGRLGRRSNLRPFDLRLGKTGGAAYTSESVVGDASSGFRIDRSHTSAVVLCPCFPPPSRWRRPPSRNNRVRLAPARVVRSLP